MTGEHSHCFSCQRVNCTQLVDNVTACAMSTCQMCGWRYHCCKGEEHTLTCQEAWVPCMNADNGCPHFLKRSHIARHLPVCPASVVSCSEEWSRWPMHTQERGVRHSLPPSKTYIDCGQLDIGLAMRDQRMLIDSLKAPHRLKRSLRNHLTQKYPAAPFNNRSPSDSDLGASADTSQTVSDDEMDTPWDLSKRHPGLRDSICRQLFHVTKETTDELATALNIASDVLGRKDGHGVDSVNPGMRECNEHIEQFPPPSGETDWQMKEREGGQEENSTTADRMKAERSTDYANRSVRSSLSAERMSDASGSRSRSVSVLRDVGGTQLHKILGERLVDESDPEICLHKLLGVNIMQECINKYVCKPASMYTFICAQNFRRDEYKWHFKNVHQEIHQGFSGWLESRCPLACQGCTFSFQRMIPAQPDTVLYHSWLQESYGLKSVAQPLDSSTCNEDSNISLVNQLNSQTEPSISDLGLMDKNFESMSFNSMQKESESTSSEGALMTRSTDTERSAVSGTSCGLSGKTGRSPSCTEEDVEPQEEEAMMMSVRPVVFTGCNSEAKVLFHYNVEESRANEGGSTSLGLTGFPIEILQQIAQHLDSFSLCNLSLTCRRLRDVCCSLLDNHGIVVLNWEREKTGGGKISWKVSNKRWMFSTSFEPIKSWKFNDDHPTIGDHLKVCPFNQDRIVHTSPFKLIPNEK